LNQVALEFWETELQGKKQKAKNARAYLNQRGISDEVQRQFRIGFSPDSWDSLLGVLRDFGAEEELLTQSGLVSTNEEKTKTYDRFRGRIMFPVLDVNGRPVAFGARALDPDDQPKYLNSPETPAYIKGEHLYGLFQGKNEIRQKQFAILVEGYLDLIALAQFGITNTAASLGTAFTPDQAKLLGRFTKRVVINYDGDDAGVKAARRAIEHLLPYDFDVKVLVLPDGKDPDDFIRENGVEQYNAARGKATTFMRFALDAAIKGRKLSNAKQKAEAIEEFLPIVTAIRNNIQKRETFDQAMEFFHVEDAGLKRELWNSVNDSRHSTPQAVTQKISRAARGKVTFAERRLLELLVHDGELRDHILPMLEVSDYENLATAELFRAFFSIHEAKTPITAETLSEYLSDEDMADVAHKILASVPKRARGEVIDGVLRMAEDDVIALRRMAIEQRTAQIGRESALAEQAGDTELLRKLTFERIQLEQSHLKLRREMGHEI
jgi:DNA primase